MSVKRLNFDLEETIKTSSRIRYNEDTKKFHINYHRACDSSVTISGSDVNWDYDVIIPVNGKLNIIDLAEDWCMKKYGMKLYEKTKYTRVNPHKPKY